MRLHKLVLISLFSVLGFIGCENQKTSNGESAEGTVVGPGISADKTFYTYRYDQSGDPVEYIVTVDEGKLAVYVKGKDDIDFKIYNNQSSEFTDYAVAPEEYYPVRINDGGIIQAEIFFYNVDDGDEDTLVTMVFDVYIDIEKKYLYIHNRIIFFDSYEPGAPLVDEMIHNLGDFAPLEKL